MDCGNLTNPVNGQISHTAGTTFGQTAIYSCNTGFNLVGDNTRTCQATGVWSQSAPTCQGTAAGKFVQVITHKPQKETKGLVMLQRISCLQRK